MTTFTTQDREAIVKAMYQSVEPIPFAGMVQTVQQGTAEWHELRRGKVTASRVADILARTKSGASASRQNYLIELALQRVTKTIEESYTNAAMQHGVDTEPQARVAYEVASFNFVDQVPFIDHPTIDWFGCSPDGLVGSDGLIEIKCPNSATHWSYVKEGKPPQKYIIQMQAQMSVTGAKWCDFVSFDPRMPERSKLLIINVPRDPEFILYMETEINQFLSEVEAEVKLMESK